MLIVELAHFGLDDLQQHLLTVATELSALQRKLVYGTVEHAQLPPDAHRSPVVEPQLLGVLREGAHILRYRQHRNREPAEGE